ncbi:MAG: hypothetical protein WBD22_15515 [Pyrinomonadaceae bacterium]
MTSEIYVDTPPNFSFRHTIYSHGWCELAPFSIDEENWRLSYVFRCRSSGRSTTATISGENGRVRIDVRDNSIDQDGLVRDIRHILRLDDDMSPFYAYLKKEKRLKWIETAMAGRLLRSPTIFEDLVKTICTTNCSWSLTKSMVTNLVEALGEPSADGQRAFPGATVMAQQNVDFYRNVMRAGYRAPYFVELAEAVASGFLDPEQWAVSELSTDDLKKEMKKIKGVGEYAAEHMLKLLGRYDGLALDSWVRSQFYKRHNNDERCGDNQIAEFYDKFGEWKGLVCWLDMTEKWILD